MNKLIYIFFLFSCSTSSQSNGQDLIGVWQKDSKEIGGDSELDRYHFFGDGGFIYYFNGYDGANRTLAIKGTYENKSNGDLIFKVTSFVEVQGGLFSKLSTSGEHNGWAIVDHGEIREVKQQQEVISSYQKCEKGDPKVLCIIIDDDKFYKIDTTPKDIFKK